MKLPAKLDPSNVIAIIDSREQTPLDLEPLTTITESLTTGDYALAACPDVCRIERKSLQDLVACVGSERERFDREVQRLLAYPVRILVVESSWEAIESHEPVFPQWRGKVTRESVLGSLMGWQAAGLSVHMSGDHERAGRHVARLLFTVARRRYAELRALTGGES
ncbi:MAG: ERCC4 domain-containing protein [Planctomycetota bacterium]|nr:ERCC4 domain-containing protein [Planctomycetota bacterium]